MALSPSGTSRPASVPTSVVPEAQTPGEAWCLMETPGWLGYMGVSLNGGTQQPLVFLPKMIILGCFGGTRKHPYRGSGDYMGVSLNGGTQQP